MAFCNAKTYRRAVQEDAVLIALLKAVQYPEAVATAQEIYRKAKAIPQDAVDYQKELQALDRALEQLGQKQAAAVKAQIAGIMQGASPDAYAEVFTDIAAQRRDMEDKRGALNRAAKTQKSAGAVQQEDAGRETFLRDLHKALTSTEATEAEKRALVGRVIEKVICQKDGADVIFIPGVFGEVCNQTFQTVPESYETKRRVFAAWASYLGL